MASTYSNASCFEVLFFRLFWRSEISTATVDMSAESKLRGIQKPKVRECRRVLDHMQVIARSSIK